MATNQPHPSHNPRLAQWLLEAPPFSELTVDQRDVVSQEMRISEVSSGETIATISASDPQALWLILEGEVVLSDLTGEALETRQAGELFGHAIVFEEAPFGNANYKASASTNVMLAQLDRQSVDRLKAASAVVASFLSPQPGDRLRALASGTASRLSDLGLRAPISGEPTLSIAQAAERMTQHQISSLPLTEQGKLVGIVTDRDLRTRVLATGLNPAQAVRSIMTAHPLTLSSDALVDDALHLMIKASIHHLPIVDDQAQLLGVVSAGDLLRTQAPHPLRLARDLKRARNVETLAQLAKLGPSVLAGLAHRGSEVAEVGRIASLLTDTITQRLLDLAQDQLGPSPMSWCWVAFGSQARMEQGLISDQDNGLILETEPDKAAADYFKKLATFVCDGLNDCGYVYCNGGVMAMGQWRMSLAKWQSTFEQWMRQPDPQSVMNCSIFFDQRAIAGNDQLLVELQSSVLEQAKEASIFLRFLAAEALRHVPALGLFNRFVQESDEAHEKGINLKKGGVLPIVDLARVRALEGGIALVHTEERLAQAAKNGIMNERDADDLIHAFRFIGNVRLKHQVARFEAGLLPNHLVDPHELSRLHQRYLRSAFGIVRRAHDAMSSRYQL